MNSENNKNQNYFQKKDQHNKKLQVMYLKKKIRISKC